MSYYTDIKRSLDSHIINLRKIAPKKELSKKIIDHLNKTISVSKEIKGQRPQNLRELIEYLHNESRRFGWSYPENSYEEECEDSYWKLQGEVKRIVQGMTGNERLYFFGYLNEYENLGSEQISSRENIEIKLFMK